jgi:predicted lactoylglutathione lyase
MVKEIWINLPVKDVKRSKEFFTKMGFAFNPHGETPNSACMLVGQKPVVVMLFEEPMFKGFIQGELADTGKGTEVLFSIDAESKEEVDEMARKAVEAGGFSSHKPGDMTDWMYGCLFTDPDGHRWNVLHMDMGKRPQG